MMPLVDTDTHVTEPPDLWTSRLPRKFADTAPRPVWVEAAREAQWKVGDVFIEGVGQHAYAGWKEYPPSYPPSLEEADPATFDARARLERMNEYGISAQVLYPNIIVFETLEFLKEGPEFAKACVEAWNNFLLDFSAADPNRLIPVMMLPFWDMQAAVGELERCAGLGHKGVLLAVHFEKAGLPSLWDERWEPLLHAAEDAELSINLHVGFHQMTAEEHHAVTDLSATDRAEELSVASLGNVRQVTDLILRGICHRFPKLQFVSVESGASWLPYIADTLDWNWKNCGVHEEFPDRELPSFYLQRQIIGTFWYENSSIRAALPVLPDNMMFETDFPHSTSLCPGPKSAAGQPRAMVQNALEGLPDALVRKAFYETAARLYKLDVDYLSSVPATAGV